MPDISLGVPFQAANVIIPVEGPKVAMATLDFNGTDGTYNVDCSQIIHQGKISYIQTLWIDNADNPNALTIIMALTGQRVIIGANVQQYVNVLAPNDPVFNFVTTTGNFKVRVGFLNVPIQPDQWGGATAGFTGLTDAQLRATPVPVSGTLNNTNTGPAIVDRSVALNGADQVALTAGQGAHYIVIQNPPTNTGTITVNLAGGSAATGIVLQVGGSIELANGCSNAVHVKGTNTETAVIFAG